jgi:hypothetical protein
MAGNNYPGPPAGPVEYYFPFEQKGPEANTFEIALVLGGTVSAGTYTAGVLDFLIEALDAWARAKQEDDKNKPTVPPHRVVLRVVTGTSGGGVNTILAARALNFSYPPASMTADEATRAKNPFFDLWVNSIDIQSLLATSDLNGATIPSLVCGNALDAAAKKGLDFVGGPPPYRDYLVNPLPIIVTLTNVAGIPYKMDFTGATGRSEYFIDHADFVRLAVEFTSVVKPPQYLIPPDALAVMPATGPGDWSNLQQYALGTAAFPAGFPSRKISRNAENYRYRYYTWVDEPQTATARDGFNYQQAGEAHSDWLTPDWSCVIPPDTDAAAYKFLALDGGCTDNEPIELARTWLAGLHARNPRDGINANRAVILVDPFADQPPAAKAPGPNPGLPTLLFPIVDTLVEANRYATADLSLFVNPNVYSRYLVTPNRPAPHGGNLAGGDAIAGARLGAFMGFMSKDFRTHDFMLGRRNCQAFLKWWFTVPANNKIFATPKPRGVPRSDGRPANLELPIIPLYGSAALDQPLPDWPAGKFDPQSISDAIKTRLDAMLKVAESELPIDAIKRWLLSLANGPAEDFIVNYAIDAIDKELKREPKL